jgi:5-formyltetrahydrofolate cyclo-ligase
MAAPQTPIDIAKRAARLAALAVRADCDPAWGAHLSAHILAAHLPPPGTAIAGFWPMPGEIDIRPLLIALHKRGHPILLPQTVARGQSLVFRHWQPGMDMLVERFGTHRPTGEPGTPDWLFIPLLAFDRTGQRLGYGGGFYDRTLAGLPNAHTVGCAFAAQEVDAVPTAEYDAPLHAIATEREFIFCR